MRCGKELARRGEVERDGCALELDPVNKSACENVPHSYALIEGRTYQPLGVRLGEADVGDLVGCGLLELPHFLKARSGIYDLDS